MENMSKKIEKKTIIILITLILIQSVYLGITFGVCKKGFHSDELWNYGISNSYDSKELMISNSGERLSNQWLDSQRFTDYITVNSGQRFAYGKVYYNASKDLNPPFQQFLLHTVCSFFPGVFSRWFSFSLNILSFIGIQIYLFLLAFQMTKRKLVAFATILLFGFGAGALDIVFFLRIYAVGIFFAVMFAYYSHIIYENRREKIKPLYFILLFVSCFFGAFTLHEFLVYAFAITICYTFYYLFSRNIKIFFIHGFSCLFAVILSFLAFPATVSNTVGNGETLSYARASYPFGMQYKFYWFFLTRDLFGIHTDPWPNPYFGWFLGIFVFVAILLIPVVVLVRKEEWFHKFIDFIKRDTKNTFGKFKNFQFSLVPQTVSVFFIVIIASLRTSIYSMGAYSNRYLFLVYPLAVLVLLTVLFYAASFVIRNKYKVVISIILLLSVILCITSHIFTNNIYFFEFPKEGFTLENFEKDANSIMVLSADWAALLFAPYLGDTGSFYVASYNNYTDDDLLDGIDLHSPLYLIMEQSLLIKDEETKELYYSDEGERIREYMYDGDVILDYYNSLEGVDGLEYVGHQVLFQRDYYIYRLMPTDK